jgi:hypothetical protein
VRGSSSPNLPAARPVDADTRTLAIDVFGL